MFKLLISATDDIQPNTRMILLNAIYFKSNWATKFDAEDTEDSDFYVDAQTVKKVPTMFAKKKFYNGRLTELDAKFVVLPYAVRHEKISHFLDWMIFIVLKFAAEQRPENGNHRTWRDRWPATDWTKCR